MASAGINVNCKKVSPLIDILLMTVNMVRSASVRIKIYSNIHKVQSGTGSGLTVVQILTIKNQTLSKTNTIGLLL